MYQLGIPFSGLTLETMTEIAKNCLIVGGGALAVMVIGISILGWLGNNNKGKK